PTTRCHTTPRIVITGGAATGSTSITAATRLFGSVQQRTSRGGVFLRRPLITRAIQSSPGNAPLTPRAGDWMPHPDVGLDVAAEVAFPVDLDRDESSLDDVG